MLTTNAIINQLIQLEHLTIEQAKFIMHSMIKQTTSEITQTAILTALQCKSVQSQEIEGFVLALKEHAVPLKSNLPIIVDIVGSGGDHHNTFNISTAAALLVAAAGYPVAKHGNRAITSNCGSADVIEALGLPLETPPTDAATLLSEHNFIFMFAPLYHAALKHLAKTRKALPFRTIFNFLGPLLNPASANYVVIGLSDDKIMEPYAQAAKQLPFHDGFIVHGADGLDEVSVTAPTKIIPIKPGSKEFIFYPNEFGFPYHQMEELKGGDAKFNAAMIERLLSNEAPPAITNAVIINAGFALHAVSQKNSLQNSFAQAKQLIQEKAGCKVLEKLRAANQ